MAGDASNLAEAQGSADTAGFMKAPDTLPAARPPITMDKPARSVRTFVSEHSWQKVDQQKIDNKTEYAAVHKNKSETSSQVLKSRSSRVDTRNILNLWLMEPLHMQSGTLTPPDCLWPSQRSENFWSLAPPPLPGQQRQEAQWRTWRKKPWA